MDGDLYQDDFYTWTRRQAAALRSLTTRQPGNEVDWPNLIEEVETLGRSEVSRVRSALYRLMEHTCLVALAPPDHSDIPHWLGEMRAFRGEAVDDYRPSMQQVLTPKLDTAWADARDAAARKLAQPVERLPEKRPFTLQALLHEIPLDELPERLRGAA
ncbi:DUF29 domain-containing protein [Roseicella aquatilis]|uniref:DUF29 domain-containing protein n=1 Tax=Roseicella aquatilis TaxID=2527868 RepID=A0A4R4DXP7_9PROT|nr:DUF29 domain-containing protein [Roseicella aquatilis]TCZ65878.1 DUF29 domain-containing protein [Roseicella aquatilis]